MTSARYFSPLALLLFVFSATPALASPETDDDFAFQGEFWGQMALPGFPRALVGLQVVAKGNGEFTARALHGGLPGAGWTGDEPLELKGARQGAFVSLYGPTLRFEVEPNAATATDSEGKNLGQLRRVRRTSPTIGLPAPSYAQVLFDGEAKGLENAELDEEGWLKIGAITKDRYSSFRLHVEFRTPYQPANSGQGRGNSGCYLLQSYEVQILDSFGLPGEFNECGALYRTVPPLVNMCLPPLAWQTYDIFFQAPKWDAEGKKKIENAKLTVFQNGQLVQDHLDVPNKTGAGKPESPDLRPILFQNHRDPVAFRNLWIVPGEPNEREIAAIEQLSYSPMSVQAFSRLNFAPVSTTAQPVPQPPSPSDRVLETPEAPPASEAPAPAAAPSVIDPADGAVDGCEPCDPAPCDACCPPVCEPCPTSCCPAPAPRCFRALRCWRR